jgi:hypothetical protein
MMCFLMNWKKGLFELRVLMRTSESGLPDAEDAKVTQRTQKKKN